MIEPTIEEALGKQINQEFTAAYNYLGMSAYFDSQSLDGFANWMQIQHDEEVEHGMRLFRYLLDRGGKIELKGIPAPQSEYVNTMSVFETALEQERENSRCINQLYELATKSNDFATKSHLQWFLDEQVEEEKSIEDIIAMLRLAKDDVSALLFLNDKLGSRETGQDGSLNDGE
jgi:ferritin